MTTQNRTNEVQIRHSQGFAGWESMTVLDIVESCGRLIMKQSAIPLFIWQLHDGSFQMSVSPGFQGSLFNPDTIELFQLMFDFMGRKNEIWSNAQPETLRSAGNIRQQVDLARSTGLMQAWRMRNNGWMSKSNMDDEFNIRHVTTPPSAIAPNALDAIQALADMVKGLSSGAISRFNQVMAELRNILGVVEPHYAMHKKQLDIPPDNTPLNPPLVIIPSAQQKPFDKHKLEEQALAAGG